MTSALKVLWKIENDRDIFKMDLIRVSTAGSVDDGKSTLIGRLLFDSKAILADQLEAVERASMSQGDTTIDLALLTDGLRAEREQKITIDVAYRYFATKKRKFILADTPGHEQYTRNMVTGASTAEIAIILVDARKGVLTQTRRHATISSLLGIPHHIIAINKMDLVDYDQDVYNEIVADYQEFAQNLTGYKSLNFVPLSALKGDNIVHASSTMPWYHGSTLFHLLENLESSQGLNKIDFRFPVQYVIRPDQSFRGFAGQVVSGRISEGDQITELPSGFSSTVKALWRPDNSTTETIYPGDSAVIELEDEIDVSRGSLLVRTNNLPQKNTSIDTMLCWLSTEALEVGKTYFIQHLNRMIHAQVTEIKYILDMESLHRNPASELKLNEIARVTLHTAQPLYFDAYRTNRRTGAFILVDPHSNNTVAAGMIRGGSKSAATSRQASWFQKASEHIIADPSQLNRQAREQLLKTPSLCLWFTGLSGSGKSTIAKQIEAKLYQQGYRTFFLDGDNVRLGLNKDLGFSQEERSENLRRVAEVAQLAFDQGHIVICSFISPLRSQREAIRSFFPEGRFQEIFVDCPLEVCQERDPKELYQKAQAGIIKNFTGIDAPFEPPEQPELTIPSNEISVEASSTLVENLINEKIQSYLAELS